MAKKAKRRRRTKPWTRAQVAELRRYSKDRLRVKKISETDKSLRWLTPPKSQGVAHQARPSSLKKSEASKHFGVTAHNADWE